MVDWLRYANQGATRNQPISPRLAEALGFLPEMGVEMEVFSGGQPSSGANRVGSHRHDHGGAADAFFYKDGRKLDWTNEADRAIFGDIVKRAKAAGVTGFGAGPGYMQPGSMHLGFGNPAVWGAGGKGANAPDWLRMAYEGAAGGSPASTAVASTAAPVANASQEAVPTEAGNPTAFGDLLAPQAPPNFASVIDNFMRSRETREAKEEADKMRRAAIVSELARLYA